ncbi:MAG: hypothetical protein AAGK04_08425 [Planctomycetota bacterium]
MNDTASKDISLWNATFLRRPFTVGVVGSSIVVLPGLLVMAWSMDVFIDHVMWFVGAATVWNVGFISWFMRHAAKTKAAVRAANGAVCPRCGYDLRDRADSDVCSECGFLVSDASARRAWTRWTTYLNS